MSEIETTRQQGARYRGLLLATVSTIALLGAVCNSDAADNDTVPFWIELGGQYVQERNDIELFSPPFLASSPFDGGSRVDAEKILPGSWDGSARLTYEPQGSDWLFSVSALYGKGDRHASIDQRTAHHPTDSLFYAAYQNVTAESSESHTIIDFAVGKDFGLGMFGNDGRSVLSLDVRYAQFNSRSGAAIRSEPVNHALYSGSHYYRFYATFAAKRKFSGVGPSLTWNSSARLLGSPSESSITLDWGLNGAVLFGRQRAQGQHEITKEEIAHDVAGFYTPSGHSLTFYAHVPISRAGAPFNREREVIVPNLGGFAGVSWCYPNAKVSIGYRADFFFGAMDGGIDAARRENIGFYGPFASVSVGIGG